MYGCGADSGSARRLPRKTIYRGTRIQVAQVLDLLAAVKSFSEITSDYFADLTARDIRACLEFAVENEDINGVEEMPPARCSPITASTEQSCCWSGYTRR